MVVYVFLQQDAVSWAVWLLGDSIISSIFLQAFDTIQMLFYEAIANYFEDVNLRNLIDFVQADVSGRRDIMFQPYWLSFFPQLFRCCGVTSPNDWEQNPYFNCSSVAFQRCSVPFSCCVIVSN